MKKPRTLAFVDKYPKVTKFLNSVSRNSPQTARSYKYGLEHLQTYLDKEYNKRYNVETILDAIKQEKINVYEFLDSFIGYLTLRQYNNTKLAPNSVRLFYAGVESYLADNDIYLIKKKVQRKIRLPKKYKVNKEPIDASDIRDILLSCTHDTLKAFILVLASSGLRSSEALSLRNADVNFSTVPTTIHIRAQISKTNQENYIFISDEASKHLKQFIDSKYSKPDEYKKYPNHLIFSKEIYNEKVVPLNIYRMLHPHFMKLLKKVDKDKHRDGDNTQRREIHFHLFRTFVFTTISNTGNTEFANWMLSHSGSTYWRSKESERRKLYLERMKYLTFLDYPTVESIGKDFESKLEEMRQEKDQELDMLQEQLGEAEFNAGQSFEAIKEMNIEIKALKEQIKKLQKN